MVSDHWIPTVNVECCLRAVCMLRHVSLCIKPVLTTYQPARSKNVGADPLYECQIFLNKCPKHLTSTTGKGLIHWACCCICCWYRNSLLTQKKKGWAKNANLWELNAISHQYTKIRPRKMPRQFQFPAMNVPGFSLLHIRSFVSILQVRENMIKTLGRTGRIWADYEFPPHVSAFLSLIISIKLRRHFLIFLAMVGHFGSVHSLGNHGWPVAHRDGWFKQTRRKPSLEADLVDHTTILIW